MSDPLPQNPFAYFGLEPQFALDLDHLEQLYFQQQRQIHPDQQRDPMQKQYCIALSGQLNQAYGILRDPYTRAKACLAAVEHGIEQVQPDPQFLMEVMTLQEQVTAANKEESRAILNEKFKGRWQHVLDNLQEAFNKANYKDAQQETIKLKYIKKLLEACSARPTQ